jgi:hypothetical protein
MPVRPPNRSNLRAQDLPGLPKADAETLVREIQDRAGEGNQFARELLVRLEETESDVLELEADVADHETRIEALEAGGGSSVEVDKLAGDVAVSSTTLATLTDGTNAFQTSIAANATLGFTARLQWHVFVGGTGPQIAFSCPAGVARVTFGIRYQNGIATEAIQTLGAAAPSSLTIVSYATATPIYVEAHGQIINGATAGTVALQVASNTGNAVTFNGGSWVEWF